MGVLSTLWGCGSDYSFRLLLILGIVTAVGRGTFFLLGLSCGIGDSLKFALSEIIYSYRSAGKMGFTDKFRLMGIGCAITVILNLLFTGTLTLFFFSVFLGTMVLHGEKFLSGK